MPWGIQTWANETPREMADAARDFMREASGVAGACGSGLEGDRFAHLSGNTDPAGGRDSTGSSRRAVRLCRELARGR